MERTSENRFVCSECRLDVQLIPSTPASPTSYRCLICGRVWEACEPGFPGPASDPTIAVLIDDPEAQREQINKHRRMIEDALRLPMPDESRQLFLEMLRTLDRSEMNIDEPR